MCKSCDVGHSLSGSDGNQSPRDLPHCGSGQSLGRLGGFLHQGVSGTAANGANNSKSKNVRCQMERYLKV